MKNCIIYLIRASEEDVNDFIKSIKSLEEYFLPHNPCDILCYHEKDLLPFMKKIKNSTNVPLNFHEIVIYIQ